MEENHALFPKFDIPAEYVRQRESFIFIDYFVDMLKVFENSDKTFLEFYTQNIEKLLTPKYKGNTA